MFQISKESGGRIVAELWFYCRRIAVLLPQNCSGIVAELWSYCRKSKCRIVASLLQL